LSEQKYRDLEEINERLTQELQSMLLSQSKATTDPEIDLKKSILSTMLMSQSNTDESGVS
jgi:hypothetical protein